MRALLIHNGQKDAKSAVDGIRDHLDKVMPGTEFKYIDVTDDDDETLDFVLKERIDFIPTTIMYDGDRFVCKLIGFPTGDDIVLLARSIAK